MPAACRALSALLVHVRTHGQGSRPSGSLQQRMHRSGVVQGTACQGSSSAELCREQQQQQQQQPASDAASSCTCPRVLQLPRQPASTSHCSPVQPQLPRGCTRACTATATMLAGIRSRCWRYPLPRQPQVPSPGAHHPCPHHPCPHHPCPHQPCPHQPCPHQPCPHQPAPCPLPQILCAGAPGGERQPGGAVPQQRAHPVTSHKG